MSDKINIVERRAVASAKRLEAAKDMVRAYRNWAAQFEDEVTQEIEKEVLEALRERSVMGR